MSAKRELYEQIMATFLVVLAVFMLVQVFAMGVATVGVTLFYYGSSWSEIWAFYLRAILTAGGVFTAFSPAIIFMAYLRVSG